MSTVFIISIFFHRVCTRNGKGNSRLTYILRTGRANQQVRGWKMGRRDTSNNGKPQKIRPSKTSACKLFMNSLQIK